MKKTVPALFFLFLIIISCSTGKKAFEKGDYYQAISKAVDRLKSSPDNKNATQVLRDGYPMTLDWTQEEMDKILLSNDRFKWEKAVILMEEVNRLADKIRSTPAARKIISDPKSYTSELNTAFEKAAEARYDAGMEDIEMNTRESARSAYDHFSAANHFSPDFKDVREQMKSAKEKATIKVILETIPPPSQRYQLSSEFFYNQVFEYFNNQYGPNSFISFYSPFQAEKENLNDPDFVVKMEFFDFSIGNLSRGEKEENLEKKIKIESKDTTRVQYKTYTAKLKTYTDQVISGGSLRLRNFEHATGKLLSDELIPGSFTWKNQYAIYVGDAEALNSNQLELTKRKVLPLPPQQDLFLEFTKPIYDQLIQKLNRFFRRYN